MDCELDYSERQKEFIEIYDYMLNIALVGDSKVGKSKSSF